MIAFTHCALHVSDIVRSVAFYERHCALKVVKEYGSDPAERTVWLGAEGGKSDFVLVLVAGRERPRDPGEDMTHYGFAVSNRADIDAIAARGRAENCLHWEPMELPPPVGYLCALRDPDGYVVEFSYGQPLGPGAKSI